MNNLKQSPSINTAIPASFDISGEFVTIGEERFYAIYNVDKMAPFFISIISPDDHWMFISSTGGLTAGRVSPETALFPYVTVDRIHESSHHTGPKTIVRVKSDEGAKLWEPFNSEHYGLYKVQRNLYRNTLGSKICFEEINLDLGVAFKYTWETSEEYGFCRSCELSNVGSQNIDIDVLDGLQNLLPSGTPRHTQTLSSNLVDAYKWTELEPETGLGMFTLYSGITDRAEPCESLKGNVAYVLGAQNPTVLLSSEQVGAFRRGASLESESTRRGIRGAYLVGQSLSLTAGDTAKWRIVVEIDLSQSAIVALINELKSHDAKLEEKLITSIEDGSDRLARIMAASDGLQATGEENVAEHHYANALYNVLRGGIFDQQYTVTKRDICSTIKMFNIGVFQNNATFLQGLPDELQYGDFLLQASAQNDLQLQRLAQEYLPITFGRRHGDPSRPWNQFAINLKDENGGSLLSYQGNWRDIFQNWEALSLSYPEFVESIIAKFVNASTMDGYNPYRITKEGIDWEVEEPDDPWSYIGYWGDHQIIYLLKLLEVSAQFHPEKLGEMLHSEIFCYANVPYKIKTFDKLLANAKDTVYYDDDLADAIEKRLETIGSDGKMVLASDGSVYQVNLLEKLLVPLLTKLSNLVLDGGIWLNTQRPEWNDANNALVGQGLSMVTLYYMRRYIAFLSNLLADQTDTFAVSQEVSDWIDVTAASLAQTKGYLGQGKVTDEVRFKVLASLGQPASEYRETVYENQGYSGKTQKSITELISLFDDAQAAIDHCISTNRREDGLYHAYNLLSVNGNSCSVNYLYPMLEGQVSALSNGAMAPDVACDVLEKLFASDIYREDQDTFMLYPDRPQTPFLQKNLVATEDVKASQLLKTMLDKGDTRIIENDVNGNVRFNSAIGNAGDVAQRLDDCVEYGELVVTEKAKILAIYEKVFNHQAFTGRSGGMFGFEGLGCIYWHMVSKLLLTTFENFYAAVDGGADEGVIQRLGDLYYKVRAGIGFNKTPEQYGAFPTDPYSHTPKHAGAQQPGMTGQVKEELVSRFAELGLRVKNGKASFKPALLRAQEFSKGPHSFRYLDVNETWQELQLGAGTLGYTWCQVPVVYQLDDSLRPSLTVTRKDGNSETREVLGLSAEESQQLFQRKGDIVQIALTLNSSMLLAA